MKKLIVNCKTGEQKYIELTEEEVNEVEERIRVNNVKDLEMTKDMELEKKIQGEMRNMAINSLEEKNLL